MTLQERRSLAFLGANLVGSITYFTIAINLYGGALLNEPDQIGLWAGLILVWVPMQLLVRILVMVGLGILNSLSKQKEDLELEDEFDKLIDLKATRLLMSSCILGVILALTLVAMGQGVGVFFAVLASSFVLSSFVGDLAVYFYYKRGI